MKLIKNRITRSCATQTQRMKYLCAQRAHHYTQQSTRIHEVLRSNPTASSNANPDTNHNSQSYFQ